MKSDLEDIIEACDAKNKHNDAAVGRSVKLARHPELTMQYLASYQAKNS